ncbi:MAG: hypothetical protein E7269_07770 [Lachnospiraceae bacterium]|nr:hypothetical protein [Lachnospiraceae bacterium]
MFEKFGEFDTYSEINELAENLFNEGDLKSIKVVAEENGIPAEVAEAYINMELPYLCDALSAALGKIDIEVAELKPKEIMEDWVEYLRGQCIENEKLALKVRKKDKSLKGCIGALLSWSFKNQQPVDKDIIKAAGVNAGKVTLGIPGMGRAKKIINKYYGA